MNLPENENLENENQGNQSQNSQNLHNQAQDDQDLDNKSQNEPQQEMNDQEQSQTSEEPSEFSSVAHAAMEGTTEQDTLAQAYDASRPSYELESEENRKTEKGEENDQDD